MTESLMKNAQIESKAIGPSKHILINDAGIGSNRLKRSNNYLNTFNYYYKNMIKMKKILELKHFERKKILEKFRKDKEIPGLMFSSAYYKYTGNDYEFFENDKNNVYFKRAKINYLQDFVDNNQQRIKLKLENKNNQNKDEYIYKSLKLSEGLIHDDLIKEEKKFVNKNKIYNYNKKNKTLHNDEDFLYSTKNNNIIKSNNFRYKISFGKTLRIDSEHQQNEKNKKRNISLNKNKKTKHESFDENKYEQKFEKEKKSKSIKMNLLNKKKLLPLIN